MKYDEIEKKVQSYRWLEGIAKEYREMIDRIHSEQDYFRVEKIAYTARGDMKYLDLNCLRTIPVRYIADGLKEALTGIDEELRQLKAELEAINIEP
jgi:DNA-binding MarR family transcriptional regulator